MARAIAAAIAGASQSALEGAVAKPSQAKYLLTRPFSVVSVVVFALHLNSTYGRQDANAGGQR